MTATTFTLVTTVPRPRPRHLMAALRAFGSAAVEVALLGHYGDAPGPGPGGATAAGAGVRNPRPSHVPAPPPPPSCARASNPAPTTTPAPPPD
ncbi:hypothetical protein ACF1BN_36100 [Streptomyces sp. NPDC014861]|uniref:hypothetical protein n=1 Tax=Streptomyces sp. NPDC014861 TaxID=3364923 RepID=UPI0036F52343